MYRRFGNSYWSHLHRFTARWYLIIHPMTMGPLWVQKLRQGTTFQRCLIAKETGYSNVTVLELVKIFPALHGTWYSLTVFTKRRHLFVSYARLFKLAPFHSMYFRSVLISSFNLVLVEGPFPSGFPTKNSVHFSSPRLFDPHCFGYPNQGVDAYKS